MTATTHADEKASPVRPKYIWLGTDVEGGTHLYRTTDETIFAFDSTGRVEHRFELDDARTVEHYVAHVIDARGWLDCCYGRDAFYDRFAEAV